MFLLFMRIVQQPKKTILLLFIAFQSLSANSQEILVIADNKPLAEVLIYLSEKYNSKIAYDSELASKILVTGKFSASNVYDIVSQVLATTTLEAIMINEVIVIRPKKIEQILPVPKTEPPPPVDFRISGVVRDGKSLELLPYANVIIAGTASGTSTNSDGFFSITTQEPDSLRLIISHLGYNPKNISISPSKQTGRVVVELSLQDVVIEDAVIVKRQPDIVATESTPGLLRWNSNRNTDLPSMNGLDIAAPLQLLPGIDGTTESLSGLLIRKSTSDKNLFVFDGFTIYHIDHFFGAFTSFNAKSVKDIRVFKGGFDARWGGRASSVIELTGKSGNANKLSVDAGLDLLSADVMVEGPMGKKVTFLFAARRSFTDMFRSGVYYKLLESARSDIILSSKNFLTFLSSDIDEPRFVYSDINTKITLKPTEKDNLSLTFFTGNDYMAFDKETLNQTVVEDSDWGNGGLGVRWARQWNEKFSHTFTLGLSQYHLDYLHADTTLRKRQNSNIVDTIARNLSTANKLNDINLNWSNTLKINNKNEFDFGLQANGVRVNLDEVVQHFTNFVPVIDTTRGRDNAMLSSTLWGQYHYSFGRIKSLKLGSRFTHYSSTRKVYFEPRFQLSYRTGTNFYFKFSGGKYYQFINQIVTYSANSFRRAWVISDDERFPVVESTHLIGGFLYRLPKGLTLDVEFYNKRMNGITIQQTVLRRTGNGNRIQEELIHRYINNRARGIDVLLHKEFPSAQIWLAYSLSRSINTSESINSGNPFADNQDQIHELKLAGTAKWRGWGVAAACIYGSGKPWDEPIFTSTMQLSTDYQKNSNRLPYYLRIDLGLNYTHKFKSAEMKTGINIFNLLNRNNQLAMVYQLSDTPLQTYFQTGTPLEYFDIMGMGIAQSVYFNVKF